ncbi:hypothetical protein [Cryobacterium breve]|uniref:hypothetical protein n=1 Tax=Cryobacterium breve TaxID=1259258 RepID=UPI00248C3C6C|nr:hypothetical protein [Cryobacterium breve]
MNWLIVVATRNASSIAVASDHTVAPPATTATRSGIVVAAAEGATADTDCASTSKNPTLRRSRPSTGERVPMPSTGCGSLMALASAVIGPASFSLVHKLTVGGGGAEPQASQSSLRPRFGSVSVA